MRRGQEARKEPVSCLADSNIPPDVRKLLAGEEKGVRVGSVGCLPLLTRYYGDLAVGR